MAKKLAALPELPTALFCANDPHCAGRHQRLYECGIRAVPGHLDCGARRLYPQYSFPPLTTVDVHYQLGSEAMELLLRRMNKTIKYARELFLYPTLIVRSEPDSSAARGRSSAGTARQPERRSDRSCHRRRAGGEFDIDGSRCTTDGARHHAADGG